MSKENKYVGRISLHFYEDKAEGRKSIAFEKELINGRAVSGNAPFLFVSEAEARYLLEASQQIDRMEISSDSPVTISLMKGASDV